MRLALSEAFVFPRICAAFATRASESTTRVKFKPPREMNSMSLMAIARDRPSTKRQTEWKLFSARPGYSGF